MVKQLTLLMKSDFKNNSFILYDNANKIDLNSIELPKSIINICKKLLEYVLSDELLIRITNDEVVAVYNKKYTFLVDIKQNLYYTSVILDSEAATIITERLIMIWPDIMFKSVMWKSWNKFLVGQRAKNSYYNYMYIERLFVNGKLTCKRE